MLVIEADIHAYVGMSYVDKNILGPLVHMCMCVCICVWVCVWGGMGGGDLRQPNPVICKSHEH